MHMMIPTAIPMITPTIISASVCPICSSRGSSNSGSLPSAMSRSRIRFCEVQLYRMNTLGLKGGAKPVVTIPADAESCGGACAMAAVQVGKGRVFVSADAMAFQPFRINEADNAALLENMMGWLLDKPVTQDMRDAFKANLFLTEKTFQQNEKRRD